MKTPKSPATPELTPSKTKLKQARLPFKLISDGTSPVSVPQRKRKLSAPEVETVSKIGKLSKENEVEDTIVLSDGDCEDVQNPVNETKHINPYVKLVDSVLKKKNHKAKTSKKKQKDKKKTPVKEILNSPSKPNESATYTDDDQMEVDQPVEEKNKESNDLSQSKLDSSVVSNISTSETPKRLSRSSSSVKKQGDESLNDSTTSTTNLTPKQIQKKLESEKKKEEKEKERLEREHKKQQEKEEKIKHKLEKEEQRRKEREEKEEAKRKDKEEKEEQKRKEKEEKEKQRELEKKLKEEKEEQKRKEREEKEEQKRKEKEAKEEEKRKKQEALELEKQEQELKKKKAAEAFVNFFVPKQKVEKDQPTAGPVSKSSVLSSFTIKVDMRLAPTCRFDLSDDKKKDLDDFIEEQNMTENDLYLKQLRAGNLNPRSCGKTWPLNEKDDEDEVMIIEDELPPVEGAAEILACDSGPREKLRPKLLSFHENRRPPYWGTWRKKSEFVKPRKPFGQDKKLLEYEVDSEEEWEEEQEGESIDGSVAGSEDEPDADEYEVDNELFVPHGYLSDEEATMDEDDVMSLSPETQKNRLKYLEDEFESEMKKPTEKLKPRLYGLLWETESGGKPENCVDALWNYFGKLAMIMNDPTELMQPSNKTDESEKKKVKKKKSEKQTDSEQKEADIEKKKNSKAEKKENKKVTPETKTPDSKKNQPSINTFLKKIKSP